jgi:hypothetical protein
VLQYILRTEEGGWVISTLQGVAHGTDPDAAVVASFSIHGTDPPKVTC